MDTTPPQKKRESTSYTATTAPARKVRIQTVGDIVCVVTHTRGKHKHGMTEHRYPLPLLEAAMLSAELNQHVQMAYARERQRRDTPTLAPGA